MHNEAYVRAVLAERTRERELAMRHARLHCYEPPRSASRMRWSFAWFPRFVSVRYRRSVAPGGATPAAGLPTSTTLG
jgi:hypothetical protein